MSTNNYRRFRTRQNSVRLLLNQLQSLHPKNRPERGGTLRPSINEEGDGDTAPIPVFYAFPLLPKPTSREPSSQTQTAPRSNTIKRRPVPVSAPETVVHRPSSTVGNGNKSPPSITVNGSTHSATLSNSKIEQIERKRKRDARRSFRESDDFLGVQGVNPRTGRKDLSEATTGTVDTLATRMSLSGTLTGSFDMGGSLDLGSVGTGVRLRVEEKRRAVRELKGRYVKAKERFREEVRVIRERKMRLDRREHGSDAGNEKCEGLRKRKEATWMLSENGWNSVFSPDTTPAVGWKEDGGGAWEEGQDGYFDVLKPRQMSVIPESPGVAIVVKEVIREIRDVKDVEDVKIGFEEFRRRCRRHRRSFK